MQGKTKMFENTAKLFTELLLMRFKDGFRILADKDPDDKFFIIDDVQFAIGDVFRLGPNGYFEKIEDGPTI